MHWVVRTALASALVAAFAQGSAQAAAVDSGALKGCEWRPAEEKGPPGRSALFCPNRHNGWRRINSEGLTPQTEAAAAAGDTHAMAIFGWTLIRLQRGQWDAGESLLQKASDRGDTLALRGMALVAATEAMKAEPTSGVIHLDAGRGAEIDYYRRAADKGDAEAMRMLWLTLKMRRETDAESKVWLRKAAEAGNAEAMIDLANQLTDREGKTGDPVDAAKWLTRAADAGDRKAMNMLSSALASGSHGLAKDAEQAKAWRAKAEAATFETMLDEVKRDGLDLEPSRFGHRQGVGSGLGDAYFYGHYGLAKNVAEGMRWYTLAADHGDEQAAFSLERLYRDGAPGVVADKALADKWEVRGKALRVEDLIAGAEDGDVGQMKQLATLYLLGHDEQDYLTAPKNPAEGLRLLKDARKADPNDAEIPMMLAAVVKAGVAGPVDPAEAQRLQAEAAKQDPVQFGPVDDLIAHADQQEAFALVILAKRLFEAGRKDEGVFWYYVGQLRGRMEASTNETAAQAYGAVFASIGPMFNEYAAGDLEKLEGTIDNVLAWEVAHPPAGVAKEVREKQRRGLADLRTYFLANKAKVRAERTKNGLPNSPN